MILPPRIKTLYPDTEAMVNGVDTVVNGRQWCPQPTLKSPSRCSGTAPLRLKPPLRATPRAPAPGPRINLANNIYRAT